MLCAGEFGGRVYRFCHGFQAAAFGTVPDDDQVGSEIFGQGGACLQKQVQPLPCLETPDEEYVRFSVKRRRPGWDRVSGPRGGCIGSHKNFVGGKTQGGVLVCAAAAVGEQRVKPANKREA